MYKLKVADSEGFEPPKGLTPCQFLSRPKRLLFLVGVALSIIPYLALTQINAEKSDMQYGQSIGMLRQSNLIKG